MERFVFDKDTNLYHESEAYLREQRILKYDLFLKQSNIPNFYYNINFENYEGNQQSETFKKIKYYAEHCTEEKFNHVSLYLWGSHSCQKSALACNIGKEAMKQGLRVKFILAGNLISKFMKLQGFNQDHALYEEIEDLKTYDMILLDDFGDPQKELQWKNNMNLITSEWDQFFRDTLSNGVKFVITSNLSIETIAQNFGESLYALIYRNFETIQLSDSVKTLRKLNVSDAFKNIEI